MAKNYSTLSPLTCNAKKSSFVSSRTMPFTEEDKIINKHYQQNYGWGSRKIFSRTRNGKPWTRIGIQHLIEKIDKTGSHQIIKVSGRPRSARSKQNITEVEGTILSQEVPETGDWNKHESPRKIALKSGVSKDSVFRMIHLDLKLEMFHRVKVQNLTEKDHLKRMTRAKRMLRYFTREKLQKTFFSDESIFTVEGRYNANNDVFYAREKRKGEVDEKRLHHGKSSFLQSVMVSAGILNLGKTSLYLIKRGVKADSGYYCQSLLSQMIPEMTALSDNGNFIFPQDGARSHTSKYTLPYMEKDIPPNVELLSPDPWPPHSPDLNPMDYSIWSSLAAKVFQVKIRSVEHLCERLGEAWEQIFRNEVVRVIHSFGRQLKVCIKAQGKRFEYKLGMKS